MFPAVTNADDTWRFTAEYTGQIIEILGLHP